MSSIWRFADIFAERSWRSGVLRYGRGNQSGFGEGDAGWRVVVFLFGAWPGGAIFRRACGIPCKFDPIARDDRSYKHCYVAAILLVGDCAGAGHFWAAVASWPDWAVRQLDCIGDRAGVGGDVFRAARGAARGACARACGSADTAEVSRRAVSRRLFL
jgi:hypothetical protein